MTSRERRRGLRMITLAPSLGYGDAACQYIAGLEDMGVPITWSPFGYNSPKGPGRNDVRALLSTSLAERLLPLLRREIDYEAVLIDMPPPARYQEWIDSESRARLFAYVAWEYDRLPETWTPVLNQMERVFVPCELNRRVFISEGVDVPIEVVPHVARRIGTVSEAVEWGSVEEDDFVFYTIGPWQTRKALEEVLRAYLDSFDARDKVALIIKTGPLDSIAYEAIPAVERTTTPSVRATPAWRSRTCSGRILESRQGASHHQAGVARQNRQLACAR